MARFQPYKQQRNYLSGSNFCKLSVVLSLVALSIEHTAKYLMEDARYFSNADSIISIAANKTRSYLRNNGFDVSSILNGDLNDEEIDDPDEQDDKEEEGTEEQGEEEPDQEDQDKEEEVVETDKTEEEEELVASADTGQDDRGESREEHEVREEDEPPEVKQSESEEVENSPAEEQPIDEEKPETAEHEEEEEDDKKAGEEQQDKDHKDEDMESESDKKGEDPADNKEDLNEAGSVEEENKDDESDKSDNEAFDSQQESNEQQDNPEDVKDEPVDDGGESPTAEEEKKEKEEEEEKRDKKKEKDDETPQTENKDEESKAEDRKGKENKVKETTHDDQPEKSDDESKEKEDGTKKEAKKKVEKKKERKTDVDPDKVMKLFTGAVSRATMLLYAESPSQKQLMSTPVPKIFVYDNLPQDLSDPETISECIDSKRKEKFDEEHTCPWFSPECSDDNDPVDTPTNWRRNYNSDGFLLRLFQNFPFKTDDPNEADLFVIPFPYWSYCLCKRENEAVFDEEAGCPVEFDEIIGQLELPHLSRENENRHVWLLGADASKLKDGAMMDKVRNGVSLSLGPVDYDLLESTSVCSSLVVPHVSTGTTYRPHEVALQAWWIRERRTALALTIDGSNQEKLSREIFNSEEIPSKIHELYVKKREIGVDPKVNTYIKANRLFQESIFCTVLSTEHAVQRRLFEVIMNGCIPVVPLWQRSKYRGYPTSHKKFEAPMVLTYPYSRNAQFFGDDEAGIDYLRDVVIGFNATCGASCLVSAIEAVLEDKEELKRRQTNLRKYAPLFTYAVGKDKPYNGLDAFAAIIANLRHYLHHLS